MRDGSETDLAHALQSAGRMTPNKLLLTSLPILSTLVLAQPAHALPAAGTNELRIESGYVFPGLEFRGFAALSEGGSSDTIFGAGVGYGRFFTDNLELGASLKYFNMDGNMSGFGVVPFLRGFMMVNDTVGLFAEGSFGAQLMMPEYGDTRTLLTGGLDLGLELFFTDSWAVRLAPNFRYMHMTGESSSESDDDVKSFGFNWGIAAYW